MTIRVVQQQEEEEEQQSLSVEVHLILIPFERAVVL